MHTRRRGWVTRRHGRRKSLLSAPARKNVWRAKHFRPLKARNHRHSSQEIARRLWIARRPSQFITKTVPLLLIWAASPARKTRPTRKCLGDALVNFVEENARDLVVPDSGDNRGRRHSNKVAADRRGVGHVFGDRQCQAPRRRKLQQEAPVRGRGQWRAGRNEN